MGNVPLSKVLTSPLPQLHLCQIGKITVSSVALRNFTQAGHQWLTPEILTTQEDQGLKPAQGNGSRDPISKKPITKEGLVECSRCRP
jgi:hypothetical protein